MVSLTDVLLAMSNIPVDDPIAEIWGRGLQGGYEIIEYTGTLPITITADGSALIDYCIYGNTEQAGTPTPENPMDVVGCGERTENLFDESTVTLGKYINAQGVETDSTAPTPLSALNHTGYIEIQPNTNYTYHYKYSLSVNNTIALCWFDASKSLISRDTKIVNYGNNEHTLTGTSPANAVFCIINFTGYLPNESMELSFNSGSTALPYEPYGYKLPMVSNSTVTDIYIGDTPLWKDEYVSYSEQKIYKFGENLADWDKTASYRMIRTINQDGSITLNTAYNWASYQFATNYDNGVDTLGLQIGHKYTVSFDVIASNYTATNVTNRCCVRYTNNNQLKYQDSQFLFIVGHHEFSFEYDEALYVSFIIASPSVTGASVTLVNFQITELIPQSPPVPLPEIPTFADTTVIDYDGELKPSQMYIKYRR